MTYPSRLYTRTAKAPALKLPAGLRYVCHSAGAIFPYQTDSAGRLVLSYVWTLEGVPPPAETTPAPAPEAQKRHIARGAASMAQQADLFGG